MSDDDCDDDAKEEKEEEQEDQRQIPLPLLRKATSRADLFISLFVALFLSLFCGSFVCRQKRSRLVCVFFTSKTSFRLKEEKNFSDETFSTLLLEYLFLVLYSIHLSYTGISLPLLEKRYREKYAEDESAKKTDWGERFVEFDREERRCVFHSHSSEIEWDRS